jgi:general secretion pathway protein D
MPLFNRIVAVFASFLLLAPVAPVQAKTRKGDRYLTQGRAHEAKKEWDAALADYERALAEDPAELVYQMAVQKARFQAAQGHIDFGLKIREQGRLGDALIEFQKAYAINPTTAVAEQDIIQTRQMIERERRRVEQTGKESTPEQRALTPAEEEKKRTDTQIHRMMAVPELRPLNPQTINLKINGQPIRTVFETIAKAAGSDVNIVWDPEISMPQPPRDRINVDLQNVTIEQALDQLASTYHYYWKPLSQNTIFITNDNPNKRRDYAEMVAKTFYLANIQTPQELQEVMNVIRSVSELQRVVVYNSQNAIIVRGEADQVALAEKMLKDIDKPRGEVVVDIMVLEASSVFSRQLAASIATTGLNVPVNFTPRASIQVQQNSTSSSNSSSTSSSTSSTTTTTATTSPTSSVAGLAIPLNQLGHLSTSDFSVTLPSALLQAVLSDAKTRVLQAPQVRSVDGVKAILKIGERQPTASGSFQPGIGGVGINPLVNTQFQYLDVGVNVEITPHVHDNGDVSMLVNLDISTVDNYVNLGGIQQPVIGQKKIEHSIRMHEGEVNLLGGLIQQSDTKTITGIPGLSSIPVLGKLFSGDSVDRRRDELMIALIPHVVRRPDLTPDNLRGIDVGTQAGVKISYAPAQPQEEPRAAAPAAPPAAVATVQPQPAPQTLANVPVLTPPVTAPPLTPPATAPPATAPPATAPSDQPAATGSMRVRFSPAQVETNMGQAVSVALQIDGGVDVASAPMQVQFDPRVLRLDAVNRGDFLSNDSQPPVFTKDTRNDTGSATIQLNRLPGVPGANGSGVLVSLSFQAVGRGPTTVTIPNLTIRNSQGQVISTSSPTLIVNVK